VVGQPVALLPGTDLAGGEVADRFDERPLLIAQMVQRHCSALARLNSHRPAIVAFASVSAPVTLFPSIEEADEILVGPESVAWQRASDIRLYLVMVYALLLQVAHPTVGAGVRDYSDFERQPWQRLLRTVDYVTLLVYGGRQAIPAGRRLRELHKQFTGIREDGERYHALEPDAYAWVHATLISTYVVGHAHFGTPMSDAEVEQFYGEYRRLGRLIGVRERDLPRTWDDFCAYFERMTTEELVHNESVDRVLRAIRRVPPPPVRFPEPLWRAFRIPAGDALRLGAIGPLPPPVRERLGIRWSRGDELRFRALGAWSRGLGPVLPERLRITGPAQLRWRQAAIESGPLGDGRPG
jgi:uncharacterized protein (DUF2236 family)